MKPKENQETNITSKITHYNNINSNTKNSFKSMTNIKRPNSQWGNFKNLRIISEEKEQKKRLGFPKIYTSDSFPNTADLYLNKNNYTFRQKNKPKNPFFEKELLFDKILKLQNELNSLNMKYSKQKIVNGKQAIELQKQNKILNLININNLLDKSKNKKKKINFKTPNRYISFEENLENKKFMKENEFDTNSANIVNEINDINGSNDDDRNINTNIKLDKGKYKISNNITEKKLKFLYTNLYKEFLQIEKNMNLLERENEQLRVDIDKIKISNEILISNLKQQCQYLEKENDTKNNEIQELKKNMKCSKYNEVLKERDIYEKEMKKMKKIVRDSFKQIDYNKKLEEDIKKLNELIKKKNFKIKALEIQLTTLSNNADETVQKLEEKIIYKDKIIKSQERKIKFKICNNSVDERNSYKSEPIKIIENNKIKKFEEILEKNMDLYQLYIEMKKKGINSVKFYINNVLKNLEDIKSISDNKIIFIESLLKLFNISDKEPKLLIINLANKEFIDNKILSEIKSNQISTLKSLFNEGNKKHLKNYEDLKKILTSKEEIMQKMKNLLEKYDKDKQGFISFNNMNEIIKEMKLENIQEEILLFTKTEIFDKMNYYKLLLMTDSYKGYLNLENNIQELNKKLEYLVNIIKNENGNINDFMSNLKETINIKKNGEKGEEISVDIEVLDINQFVEFLSNQNIEIGQMDKDIMKQIFQVDELLNENDNIKYQNYIDYKKIINKLDEFSHNENVENDDQNKNQEEINNVK